MKSVKLEGKSLTGQFKKDTYASHEIVNGKGTIRH